MPDKPDVLVGKALAEIISTTFTGRIRGAKWTYDVWSELEDPPDDTYVWIAPDSKTEVRQTRGHWQTNCRLMLWMIAPVNVSSEADVDVWYESYDEVIEVVKHSPVLGHKAMSIEQDTRYSREKLNDKSRLVMVSLINYFNV